MSEGPAHVHSEGQEQALEDDPDHRRLGFDAFGVRFSIAALPEVLERIATALPPGAVSRPPADGDAQFVLRRHYNGVYQVEHDRGSVSGSSDLRIALEVLGARLREHVALHAPDHVFVHAGVVGHAGRAIVIPGMSFSGKTTLVSELVRAGADYYSDEYAILDGVGLVHPYPKPLSIRVPRSGQIDRHVGALGGSIGMGALPVGLVVVTTFEPGGRWEPQRRSGGEAVLRLLANTVPAQERPDQCLSAITKAVTGAVALESPRGEAAEIVDELLAAVDASA